MLIQSIDLGFRINNNNYVELDPMLFNQLITKIPVKTTFILPNNESIDINFGFDILNNLEYNLSNFIDDYILDTKILPVYRGFTDSFDIEQYSEMTYQDRVLTVVSIIPLISGNNQYGNMLFLW